MSEHIIIPKQTKGEKLKAIYHKLTPQERQGIIALFGVVLLMLSPLIGWAFQHLWYAKENSILRQTNAELKDQLRDMTADRNRQETRLAPFLAAGDKFFTNTPANERLNLLLESISAMLQRSPAFSFWVNDFPITNDCYITIPTTNNYQDLHLIVRNEGQVAADGITFVLTAPEALTLTTSVPWTTNVASVTTSPDKLIRQGTKLCRCDSAQLLATNAFFSFPA